MNSDLKAQVKKSTRDRTLIKIPKSPAIMAYGISTKFQPSDSSDFCDKSKLLLQDEHAGSISDMILEDTIAKVDKLLEYKCIYKKQHKQDLESSIECYLSQEKI